MWQITPKDMEGKVQLDIKLIVKIDVFAVSTSLLN